MYYLFEFLKFSKGVEKYILSIKFNLDKQILNIYLFQFVDIT